MSCHFLISSGSQFLLRACTMVPWKETRCPRLKRRKLRLKPFPLPKRFMVIMHTKLSWRPKTLLVCFDNENSTLSITQKWVQKWINTYVHNLSATFYDNYLHCLFEDRIWAGRVWSLTLNNYWVAGSRFQFWFCRLNLSLKVQK